MILIWKSPGFKTWLWLTFSYFKEKNNLLSSFFKTLRYIKRFSKKIKNNPCFRGFLGPYFVFEVSPDIFRFFKEVTSLSYMVMWL